MLRLTIIVATVASTLAMSGCDRAESRSSSKPNSVVAGNQSAVSSSRQIAGAAGKIDIQLDNAKIDASGCFARLIVLHDGRPNILQITNYADPKAESFPSVFIRAQVAQTSPGAIAGRRIEAQQMYIQLSSSGPIWKTPDGQSVQLSISDVDGNRIEATINGVLVDAVTNESTSFSAKLVGEIEAPQIVGGSLEPL